jgi:hypothetical protein
MDLPLLLTERKDAVLAAAAEAMRRSHLASYERVGAEETKNRLRILFERVVQSVSARRLDPMHEYGERLAQERFGAGFHLLEVQAAMNVLEEALWTSLLKALPPEDALEALRLVSTALGASKDAVARTYVELATKRRAPALDVASLFKGTESPGAV